MVVRTPPREKNIDLDEVIKLDEVNYGDGCVGCGEEVTNGQFGMEYEICRDWFLTKCEGVSQKNYMKMKEIEKLIWMCKKCERSLKEVSERNRKLSDENKKLKEKNKELKKIMYDLEESMRSLKKEIVTETVKEVL